MRLAARGPSRGYRRLSVKRTLKQQLELRVQWTVAFLSHCANPSSHRVGEDDDKPLT
jgi:hypothetical protein